MGRTQLSWQKPALARMRPSNNAPEKPGVAPGRVGANMAR